MLLAWALSWITLYFLLRERDTDLRAAVIVFVIGMALATLLIYTPFIDFMLGK